MFSFTRHGDNVNLVLFLPTKYINIIFTSIRSKSTIENKLNITFASSRHIKYTPYVIITWSIFVVNKSLLKWM